MQKTKHLIPTLTLSLATVVSGMAVSNPVSAEVVTDVGETAFTVEEMLAFRERAFEEIERCGVSNSCRYLFYTVSVENVHNYRAFDAFLDKSFMITAINPTERTMKVLYNGYSNKINEQDGFSTTDSDIMTSLTLGWLEGKNLEMITADSNGAPNINIDFEHFHYMYNGNSDSEGENWLPSNVESEVISWEDDGADMEELFTGYIRYELRTQNRPYEKNAGGIDIGRCINSRFYQPGMECRLAFTKTTSEAVYLPYKDGVPAYLLQDEEEENGDSGDSSDDDLDINEEENSGGDDPNTSVNNSTTDTPTDIPTDGSENANTPPANDVQTGSGTTTESESTPIGPITPEDSASTMPPIESTEDEDRDEDENKVEEGDKNEDESSSNVESTLPVDSTPALSGESTILVQDTPTISVDNSVASIMDNVTLLTSTINSSKPDTSSSSIVSNAASSAANVDDEVLTVAQETTTSATEYQSGNSNISTVTTIDADSSDTVANSAIPTGGEVETNESHSDMTWLIVGTILAAGASLAWFFWSKKTAKK